VTGLFLLLLASTALAAAPVEYTVTLADAPRHLVHVRVHLPAGSAERDLQLPAWNALYQIRDFSQYVLRAAARNPAGQPLAVRKTDKNTWRLRGGEGGADFEYDILANLPGPFGAEFNSEHAFFNLAEILVYAVDARNAPVTVAFAGVPGDWLVALLLPAMYPAGGGGPGVYSARDYDQLVDSPVEIGMFEQVFFQEGGASYRIVVRAAPGDYSLDGITRMVRTIVKTEVAWMEDRPFADYLFIYHFPHAPGGGGMEHANATAIELGADRARNEPLLLASLTAHEFFHLWNVKRIRSQSLEPVDYTRENYTTALWFSEGVTSTVTDFMLLRAGLLDESSWLAYLGREIGVLQRRPARQTQSVEESSLDAWLEKYPEYRLPERSISYYNKGELVGILLDLAVREATGGQRSLRDVFHWMNQHYAQKHRFFPDTEGVRQAVQAVTGKDLGRFFEQYVAGVAELPYDESFRTVGLRVERREARAAYAGFRASSDFGDAPVVAWVDAGSEAQLRGLAAGDTILTVNGKPVSDVEARVAQMHPGDTLKLRVVGRDGTARNVKIKLGAREREEFRVVNLPDITPEQRARRAAWLTADDQAPKDAPKGAVRAGVVP